MWGSFNSPKFKCFLCQGTGSVYICKNPIKENLIEKKNKKLKEIGEEEQVIGKVKVPCFQCSAQGIMEVDTQSSDFRRRHKNL